MKLKKQVTTLQANKESSRNRIVTRVKGYQPKPDFTEPPIEVTVEVNDKGEIIINGMIFNDPDGLTDLSSQMASLREVADSSDSFLYYCLVQGSNTDHRAVADVKAVMKSLHIKERSDVIFPEGWSPTPKRQVEVSINTTRINTTQKLSKKVITSAKSVSETGSISQQEEGLGEKNSICRIHDHGNNSNTLEYKIDDFRNVMIMDIHIFNDGCMWFCGHPAQSIDSVIIEKTKKIKQIAKDEGYILYSRISMEGWSSKADDLKKEVKLFIKSNEIAYRGD